MLNEKPFVVAFSAETNNVIENSRAKLEKKNADMIVANQVGDQLVFDMDESSVTIISKDNEVIIENQSKHAIAQVLLKSVLAKLSTSPVA